LTKQQTSLTGRGADCRDRLLKETQKHAIFLAADQCHQNVFFCFLDGKSRHVGLLLQKMKPSAFAGLCQ
jgi:hypothetical protein